MIRAAAIAVVFASVLLIGAAYASAFFGTGAPAWAGWAMSLGTAALLVSLMALGAVREGGLGSLGVALGVIFLLLAGGFGLVLSMPASPPPSTALWLGLPPGAALVLYGIGLVPVLVAPVAYALTFDRMTLSAADLERVHAAMAARSDAVAAEDAR
jgi:hypothetical protein